MNFRGYGASPDKFKEPLPKTLKEWPGYLRRLLSGFFSHLFFIFRISWKASPAILILMTLFSLASGILPAIAALLTKEILNKLYLALSGELTAFHIILTLIIFFFLYRFVSHLITVYSQMVYRLAGELVSHHIKMMIAEKTKELDLASFDDPSFYERLENANREAGNRPVQIVNSFFDGLSHIITMISFVVILAGLSFWAPVLMLLLAVPTALINFIFRKKTFLYMRRNSKDRREMNYYTDVLVNKDRAKEIRLMDLSDDFIRRYKTVFTKYYRGIRRLIVRESLWKTGFSLLSLSGYCVLFLYVAYQVYRGVLQIGDYSLYTGALSSITGSISSLIVSGSAIYEGTLFIDNLMLFLKEKRKIVSTAEIPAEPARGIPHKIEFRRVSFSYPGSEKKVLDDVSFTIRPGSTAVLVGINGAGKTTIIKLLTRLYDPTEGTILLDGADIRTLDTSAYYDLFGILFQDFGQYAVSAGDNISFGDLSRTDREERMRYAAHESGADAFIEPMPRGYDTPLTRLFEETGTELSTGQWQKLSIARAYFKDSDIMILDEPTASLDALAEQEIFNKFDALRSGKTTLFVSHRLSSAVSADQIIVISGGRVAEEGTHAELMDRRGIYYKMFLAQAKKYAEGYRASDGAGSD
ncbi:MAG: ABC transporter ATP-binding protein [Clostridia bacterium]|nr:ABC transporter ATP-binding protein [Clostridia bacterium]